MDQLRQSRNREEYFARINRVIDYIETHLDEPLQLESLAELAHFSPFHFHRIFSTLMGETLNHFVKRIRLEKAASQLIYNPKRSITEIALDCGFTSSATFARAFREAFNMSASRWRDGGQKAFSKNRKVNSKNDQMARNNCKAVPSDNPYASDERRQSMTTSVKARVEVKVLPERHVAYVRYIGDYRGKGELFEGLFNKLMRWAGPRGLFTEDTQMISIYHDDPGITDNSKLRLEVAITVPEGTAVEGEIGSMNLAGGKYAVAHFEIDEGQYGEAWDYIYGEWLPESGYMPEDAPPLEVYLNNPDEHPEHKHLVDICIPVKPL